MRFLYKIYKLLIKEPDNNLFEEISDVNLVLGKYYLENKNIQQQEHILIF